MKRVSKINRRSPGFGISQVAVGSLHDNEAAMPRRSGKQTPLSWRNSLMQFAVSGFRYHAIGG